MQRGGDGWRPPHNVLLKTVADACCVQKFEYQILKAAPSKGIAGGAAPPAMDLLEAAFSIVYSKIFKLSVHQQQFSAKRCGAAADSRRPSA